jgi:hypothetical protein
VFENRVLRRIFVLKGDEVKEECRKLHKEELHDLCTSPNIFSGKKIEKNEMGGAFSTYGGEEMCIQGFGGEACGKETSWKSQG